MQYLFLLPGLALVDRGNLFVQARAHVTCKDGSRADDTQNNTQMMLKSFQNVPGDQLVTRQAEQVVDVGSMS